MTVDTNHQPARRVRHEIADGVRLMAFSLGSSIGLALLISIGLGQL
jgi:PleD family two-component response regulator